MGYGVQYSRQFMDLLDKVQVPESHLRPRQPASVATTMAESTVESMRRLSAMYDVPTSHMMRVALVIGIEELLGAAKELSNGS